MPIPTLALQKVQRSKAPLGTLLLRQDVVAGAGLIWRSEAPFLAGVAPQRPGRAVDDREWDALWQHLRTIMTAARHEDFFLFRRGGEPCRVCSTTIRAAPMAGRHRLVVPDLPAGLTRPGSRTCRGPGYLDVKQSDVWRP